MSSKVLSTQDWKKSRHPNKLDETQDRSGAQDAAEFRGLPNKAIITLVLTLVGFGLMSVYSASAPEALESFQDSTVFLRKQAIACVIGLFVMFTLSRHDYRKLRKWVWPFTLISFGLVCLTLIPSLSRAQMGATRWLALGPVMFQPSELVKVACILLMASGLSKYFWWHRQVAFRVVIVMIMAGIVVKQPDLGSALMIMGTLLSMLYVSGTNFGLIATAIGGGAVLVWHHIQKTPYQMARISSWLNPYKNPQGEGWNIIQAQLAIGSGGLWGVGFGRSLQKLHYLPVQHADFIFAVIAEEFGMVGCMALITLFALFGYYGFKTALEARTLFGRFLGIGITSSICLQAVTNIAVTTGLLPVTGITLPFISYGGSSLVITLGMIGILLSISRDKGHIDTDEVYEVEGNAPT